MSELRFDAQASKLTIETTATGMLAKLAHDLSIVARSLRATATVDGQRFSIEVDVPVGELEVDGVRKHGVVDRSTLSSSDKNEIQRKMRDEVLGGGTIVARAEGELPQGALEGTASVALDVTAKVERASRTESVRSKLTLRPSAERVTAEGRFTVHLPALGIAPIKGPLGAFRVNDDIHVDIALVFTR
jgi:hypothetical protein